MKINVKKIHPNHIIKSLIYEHSDNPKEFFSKLLNFDKSILKFMRGEIRTDISLFVYHVLQTKGKEFFIQNGIDLGLVKLEKERFDDIPEYFKFKSNIEDENIPKKYRNIYRNFMKFELHEIENIRYFLENDLQFSIKPLDYLNCVGINKEQLMSMFFTCKDIVCLSKEFKLYFDIKQELVKYMLFFCHRYEYFDFDDKDIVKKEFDLLVLDMFKYGLTVECIKIYNYNKEWAKTVYSVNSL